MTLIIIQGVFIIIIICLLLLFKVVGVTSLASTLMTLKRYEDAQKTIAKHEAKPSLQCST
jgi:hypothetical protein